MRKASPSFALQLLRGQNASIVFKFSTVPYSGDHFDFRFLLFFARIYQSSDIVYCVTSLTYSKRRYTTAHTGRLHAQRTLQI